MKRTILLISLISIFLMSAQAQTYEDVVYLKNGSIIRGIIVEQVPNQTIKIQTKDRNVFVFTIAEVEKLTKEQSFSKSGKRYAGVAFALSFGFPGVGQMYNRQYSKGAIMMALEVIGSLGIAYSYLGDLDGDGVVIIGSFILSGANYLWSMIDAPVSASAINRENGLSLNYDLNRNFHFALKPDYRVANINGKYSSVFGAKLSLSFN